MGTPDVPRRMAAGLLLRGGTVVDSGGARRADVLVDGQRIAEVGPDLDAASARVVDAAGAYVVPGGIDVHTRASSRGGHVRRCLRGGHFGGGDRPPLEGARA